MGYIYPCHPWVTVGRLAGLLSVVGHRIQR